VLVVYSKGSTGTGKSLTINGGIMSEKMVMNNFCPIGKIRTLFGLPRGYPDQVICV
jgi:hypothetical protein